MSERAAPTPRPQGLGNQGASRWLGWMVGAAILATVVGVALHVSEGRAILELAQEVEPAWMLVALALQAGTYLAQAQVWRRVVLAAECALSIAAAYRIGLVKLFVDQALPSAGLSGAVMVVQLLEQRGVPRAAAMASFVVDVASHFVAFAGSLAAAVVVTVLHRHAGPAIVVSACLFAVAAMGLVWVVLALPGRGASARPMRPRLLARMIELVRAADPRLARDPSLLLTGVMLHVAILLLDAATLWSAVASLGTTAPVIGVFASFMIANLFRKIGFVPGGLGTFEAASVVTLNLVGIDVATALGATLLFRGLSFWLPMAPGLLLARRAATARPSSG